MKNIVIIGASHAAAEAISTLRKNGWSGGICLVGDEQELPYQRPPLSKAYCKGDIPLEKLFIKNEAFYEKANVTLFLGRRAEWIDRQARHILLDGGEVLPYEKLIIATGTRARQLPIEGADLDVVKYLRTISDAKSIQPFLSDGNRLLIIGAGYIGLEVAASARKLGCSVVVLETADRVLARVTSPTISEFYQTLHTENGVDIRLSTGVSKLEKNDRTYTATLSDGESLSFDCAIVGIGVLPNVELAKDAGLSCENGIVVNELTQTDDPNIYAVGDCSMHPNALYNTSIRLESVPNAMAQAKTAALSICGKDVAYNQLPWFWSDQYDVKLQTAGLLQGYDDAVIEGDIDNHKFTVSYLKNGQLIALDAINSPAQFMRAKKQITTELAD